MIGSEKAPNAQPTSATGSALPQRILGCGQASLALTIGILVFVALVNLFNAFNLVFFFVLIYLLVFCVMLMVAAIARTTLLTTYFGFLNYYLGSGSMLIIVGTLTLGIYGTWGHIIGAITITWGVIEIIAHFYFGRGATAVMIGVSASIHG